LINTQSFFTQHFNINLKVQKFLKKKNLVLTGKNLYF